MAHPSPPYSEQRRFPRVQVEFAVEYRPASAAKQAKMRKDPLITLGEGGCFIQTKLTYPAGTELQVQFPLEGKMINAVGVVRYAIAFQPGVESAQFPGMGLKFKEITGEQIYRIREYVVRKRSESEKGITPKAPPA